METGDSGASSTRHKTNNLGRQIYLVLLVHLQVHLEHQAWVDLYKARHEKVVGGGLGRK